MFAIACHEATEAGQNFFSMDLGVVRKRQSRTNPIKMCSSGAKQAAEKPGFSGDFEE
jgi:hypothetical protein